MNTRDGYSKGPYIQIVATSLSKNPDFEDNHIKTLRYARENGTFYAKSFGEVNLRESNSNHIACLNVTLDNSILNYDSNSFATPDFTPYLIGKFNIDNVNEFLKALWGPDYHKFIYFDQKLERISLLLGGGVNLEISNYCAQVLGFSRTSFQGPCKEFATYPVDLYKKFRPLIVNSTLVESSFVSDSTGNVIALLDTTESLLPHSNKQRTMSFSFSALNWVRMLESPGVYIKLIVTNADNEIVSFSPFSEITITFKIRTYPYDLL